MEPKKTEAAPAPAGRRRSVKPGRVRAMVSLTEERYAQLQKLAETESPLYPRPVNEFLTILIEKKFDSLISV